MILNVYKEVGTYSLALHYYSDPTSRNPSNQWQHSFQWNLHSYRLKTSRQRRIAAIKVPVRKSGANNTLAHMLIRSCMREPISIVFDYINPFNKRQMNEFADLFKNLSITGSHQTSKLINWKHLFHIWIHTYNFTELLLSVTFIHRAFEQEMTFGFDYLTRWAHPIF